MYFFSSRFPRGRARTRFSVSPVGDGSRRLLAILYIVFKFKIGLSLKLEVKFTIVFILFHNKKEELTTHSTPGSEPALHVQVAPNGEWDHASIHVPQWVEPQ